jgi:hypothetical protein
MLHRSLATEASWAAGRPCVAGDGHGVAPEAGLHVARGQCRSRSYTAGTVAADLDRLLAQLGGMSDAARTRHMIE